MVVLKTVDNVGLIIQPEKIQKKKMTLILTEIATDGIAMAADSLWTHPPSGSTEPSPKLFEIPDINAGISTWGGTPDGCVTQDNWIQKFFRKHEGDFNSIPEFASLFAEEAIDYFGKVELVSGNLTGAERAGLGFHIAGYENGEPHFFNLNNNPSQGEPEIRDKNSASVYLENWNEEARNNPLPGRGWLIHNGDWEGFRQFFEFFKAYQSLIRESFPHFSLPGSGNIYQHAKYLGLLILFTGGIYQLSNLTNVNPTHIGGEIHTMSMNSKITRERKTLKVTGDGLVLV